jgi:hypothetical protein
MKADQTCQIILELGMKIVKFGGILAAIFLAQVLTF